MRAENRRMRAFLKANNITAIPKYIVAGSLRGTWRLYNPDQAWTPALVKALTELGFTNFEGEPLDKHSANGGRFSVFVRGHDELLQGDAPAFPLGKRISVTPAKQPSMIMFRPEKDFASEPERQRTTFGRLAVFNLFTIPDSGGADPDSVFQKMSAQRAQPFDTKSNRGFGSTFEIDRDKPVIMGAPEPRSVTDIACEAIASTSKQPTPMAPPEVSNRGMLGWALRWPDGFTSAMPNEEMARAAHRGITGDLKLEASTDHSAAWDKLRFEFCRMIDLIDASTVAKPSGGISPEPKWWQHMMAARRAASTLGADNS